MKTVGEAVHGQHIDVKCPFCEREWKKRVMFGRFTKCDNTRCNILLYLEQQPSGDIMVTFSVNPKKANAAAIQSNIMSRKTKADLVSNDYNNTIN